jgi:hypothetical protein
MKIQVVTMCVVAVGYRRFGGHCCHNTTRYRNPECRDLKLYRLNHLTWDDNIRLDLREVGWKGVGWIHLVQDRGQWQALVNTVMKFQVP